MYDRGIDERLYGLNSLIRLAPLSLSSSKATESLSHDSLRFVFMMRNVTRKVVEIVGKKRGVDKTPLSCYSICIVNRERKKMIDCFVNGSVKLSEGATLKGFMEFMWDLESFDGLKVVDKWVGFGALPDIKLVLENGHQISCKRLWQERV